MKLHIQLFALTMAAGIALGLPAASEPVRFLAFGDMPYKHKRKHLARVADLIEAGNRLNPDFMVHLGDIKGGGTPCTDEAYQTVLELLQRSEPPLFYTPGDNDWTDCHRKSAGSYDSAERLSLLRKLFFAHGRSLGRKTMQIEEQSIDPEFAQFIENRRWRIAKTVFVTLHIVGSNNNYRFDASSREEHGTRMRAVLSWMQESFAEAKRSGAGAVVLFFHADPLFEIPFLFRSGFNGFIDELEQEAVAFGKPVLIVHGDWHRLVLDRPLHASANLVRLIVPGNPRIEGILITADPDAELPFVFTRVPGGERLEQTP